MNIEIGAEAALFPEKEYINGIAVAVRGRYLIPLIYNKNLHLLVFLHSVQQEIFSSKLTWYSVLMLT